MNPLGEASKGKAPVTSQPNAARKRVTSKRMSGEITPTKTNPDKKKPKTKSPVTAASDAATTALAKNNMGPASGQSEAAKTKAKGKATSSAGNNTLAPKGAGTGKNPVPRENAEDDFPRGENLSGQESAGDSTNDEHEATGQKAQVPENKAASAKKRVRFSPPRKPEHTEKEEKSDEDDEGFRSDELVEDENAKQLGAKMSLIARSYKQTERYSAFRRSTVPNQLIRDIFSSFTGTQSVSPKMIIVLRSIAKLFIGQIVEESRLVMEQWKDIGAIRPIHMREAYRRLNNRHQILGGKRQLFQH